MNGWVFLKIQRSIDGYLQYMIDDLSILDDKKLSSPFPFFEQMKNNAF